VTEGESATVLPATTGGVEPVEPPVSGCRFDALVTKRIVLQSLPPISYLMSSKVDKTLGVGPVGLWRALV
jgi:hypothetical protein